MLEVPPTLSSSTSSGPVAPIQDDGTLEQPNNPNRYSIMNNRNANKGFRFAVIPIEVLLITK